MNSSLSELIEQFKPENLQRFFQYKISSFKPIEEDWSTSIPNQLKEQFSDLIKLGEAEYVNTDELLVFACKYRDELSSRSSKKKQYDLAKKVLKEDFKDGAIFVFYDSSGRFRFSFIRKNYGEKDKKYSNWKRYTYFVDPKLTNRTFIQRIETSNFSSLDEIMEAFSVEPLNKEFYERIVRSFYSLVGGEVGKGRHKEKLESNLTLPGNLKDRKTVRQFGVRLIGRIIFCWFLKHKKSSKGVPLIPTDWLTLSKVKGNYYHERLELLFFEILNKEMIDRPNKLPSGHELIPFLNGGLFEPQSGIDSDFYEGNKKSEGQRAIHSLKIKDKWFRELFLVLEQYNFTIDENSINDAEVSIDPEMLGRIFENLLAEIDPNLDSGEKKSVKNSTGSFYTPREIVDYMVEEALVKYIHNQTQLSEKGLHQLFGDREDVEFSDLEKEHILDALNQVKILDPAAGSGAFPMGALHKIVLALQKLDPGAEKWKIKQLNKITNAAVKSEMKEILNKANAEYSRKLGVLQNCIYGADIQPIAAEISRLRSFLSLIVDEVIDDDKKNRGIIALPNLEFKFVTANTLIDLDSSGTLETTKVSDLIPQLQKIRQDYLQAHGIDKEELRKQFRKLQKDIYTDQLLCDPNMESRPMQLANWDPFKNEVVNWFEPEWMFGVKQFDIVIGNPPYGGTKIDDKLKNKLRLGSKDPYGAFIAKYLRGKKETTALKHGGLLAFIASDTFMTIKSHKQLRDFILENQIHSMVRVHPDTFKATVNTAVILCERLEKPKDNVKPLLMADFTNTSIHQQYDRFIQLLDKVTEYNQPSYATGSFEEKEVLYMKGEYWTSESSKEYAVYTYPQSWIETNSNHPFFVASPKLFGLMNDTIAPKKQTNIDGKIIQARSIDINKKSVEVVKLGDVAEVKVGLQTGDNDSYLFQNPEARGTYKNINDFKEFLLIESDLDSIRNNENLRRNLINKGISKDNPDSNRYFGGKYIVPYDKGGESDSDDGWLPNYYVPTNYFIDWSEWAVKRMKTLTTKQRNEEQNKKGGNSKLCSRFQNSDSYFLNYISYSRTGMYAPTYRVGNPSPYDNKSCGIFPYLLNYETTLGILNSKLQKALFKNCLGHSVDAQVDDVKEISIIFENKINQVVRLIISNQRDDINYDYNSFEQLEIDYLVYQAYGLNWADIMEVENWYARRYPKLVNAQKRNLANLGKPTNYIEIYKGFVDKFGDVE